MEHWIDLLYTCLIPVQIQMKDNICIDNLDNLLCMDRHSASLQNKTKHKNERKTKKPTDKKTNQQPDRKKKPTNQNNPKQPQKTNQPKEKTQSALFYREFCGFLVPCVLVCECTLICDN